MPIPIGRPPSPEPEDLFLSRSCPTLMDNPYRPLEASISSSFSSVGNTNTLSASPPNVEGQSRPTRPRVSNRVVSSPTSPERRRNSSSRTRHGTIFASFNRPRSSRREWSVFEQRMENEGQMRTKNALRESVSESVVPSPFQPPADLSVRSESPAAGAPSLRRVVVEDGHESDDASTIEDDSDSGSDSEDSSRPSTPPSIPPRKRRWYSKWRPRPLTPLQRNILKCAVAYFVGSLFTFNLTLSNLITSVISTETVDERTPSKSGHLVATV